MSKFLDPTREDDDRLLLSLKDRQLHTLFATTLDAIAIADDQGLYLDVNPAACELFGLTRQELLGRSISDFAVPGFDFQAEWQEFQQQETVRGEFQLVRADGDLRVVEYVAAANFLPHRHLSILRDITKQHAALCERQQAEIKIKELNIELDQLRPRPLSELEKAQAQLRESQQRLESILGSIEGVVWSVHPETFATIYINSAVEQIFGYSVADFLERPNLWQEVIHPEDRDILTSALPKLFENGKTKTKYRIIRSDRQVRWVLVNSSLVYDETGKPIRIDGITTDITEHQQSKQLLEKVTEHIPGAIYQFRQRPDGTFHFPYANQNLELICGISLEELQEDASRAFSSISPEDLDRVMESTLESSKSLTPWYCEYRMCLPDGQIQWLLCHATPQRELDGSTVWYGYICDITDQKYIETALIESEVQNRAILQAIPDLIFRVNSQGIYLDYPQATELPAFQGQANSSIGKNMADYLPPEVYQRQRHSMDIALATRQTQIYEQEVTIDGRIQYEEVRVVPIEGLDEVLFIIRDISEQQAALQERKQAELENIKNQNFLSSIIENIPNMVFVKDAEDLKFIRFNKAGEELLGYSREALLGKNDYDFFPLEEADFFIEKDREVLASGRILDIPEEQIQTNHQGVRIVHTRKIPILDKSGNSQYLLGISEDITDLKKSEARLREVTQLQQAILDGANYVIVSTDLNGLIKTINAAAQRNLGYTAAEVVDQLTPTIFHDLEEIKQRAAELTLELGREISVGFEVFTIKAALGIPDEYEWTCIRKNGSRFPMQLSVTALRDEEGSITGFLGIIRDISEQKTALSEQKLAEAALAESEAQNRAILQAIPDLMFRVDRAGTYLSYSESTKLFDCLGNKQSLGKPMIDYLPSELYQRHKHYLELALETGQIQNYEQEVTIDGHYQQEEVRVVPIEGKEEVLFIIRDISDRKHAEAALAESENQNKAILQAIPDLMFRVDRAGIYLSYSEFSKSTELLDSLSNQQALGKSMMDYLPPEIYQRQKHYIEIALATKQIQMYEQEVTIDGHYQQEEVRVVPIEGKEEVLFIIRDITDRKRQEQSLRLIVEGTAAKIGEEFFKSCVQYLAQALEVRDAFIAEFADTEKSVATTLAFWSGNDFGDNFSYQIRGSLCENIQGELCRYPHSVQSLFPENQSLVARQVESYAGMPILDAEGNSLGLLVVIDTKPMIQDIETQSAILKIFATRAGAELERMQAEEAVRRSELQLRLKSTELEATLKQLQNTQAQLIQSEKMSGLGQLVAGIAHEINNPVSFIHGNIKPAHDYASNLIELIRLYQTHYPSPPAIIADFTENIELNYLTDDFPKLLKSMKIGATRITDIVKSLRTFSRLDETGLKAIDLHENIDSTLAVLQNRLNGLGGNPEISLMRNYGDLPLIEAYGGLLNQVFMNLLVNAIDAIEQHQNSLEPEQRCNYKGMITISTSAITSTNQAIISIRDNGSGMSSQIQEKIFNPFFTTKPVGKGTGMGLAISYQIMEEKHHGNISVNSTPDQGTEFMITLPITQTPTND